jgi:hydrogenase-4 component B
MNYLLMSTGVSFVGALLALVLKKNDSAAKGVACLFGAVAATLAVAAGLTGIFGQGVLASYYTPLSFAQFSLLLNPLSGLILLLINVLAFAAWIYGFSYFNEYEGKAGYIGFFMNLFTLAMNYVVTSDNAFWFLVFFELMSMTSYFLVIVDHTEEGNRGGLMYLIVAHVGFLLIMISYMIMATQTGSLEFQSFRYSQFAPETASLAFMLAFFGFGCKAGIVPLHSWLPQAHPAAPSNVSAMMSGGMIKIGIFGMLKVGLDMLGMSDCQLWWGIVVLAIGCVSAIVGVTYAIKENDIKRLLAYSSVENIGIILMGVGVAFVGVSLGNGVLAAVALMAALYHALNHAMFKGLLFMGAGSVLYATGTRNMQVLGGLIRIMPVTAMCFLIGALAISAIPPLNGFVSEWYTYQSMFDAAMMGDTLVTACMALAAVSLAITGALAAICFVKAYGVTFLGGTRSDIAAQAKEVPVPMRAALILLAVFCVALGLGAPWVAPVMQHIASSVLDVSSSYVALNIININPMGGGMISLPLIALLLIVMVLFASIYQMARSKGGFAADREPWACGYNVTADMAPASSTFGSQVDIFMHPLYQARDGIVGMATSFQGALRRSFNGAEGVIADNDATGRNPFAGIASWLGAAAQKIEGGDFRRYIVYIVVALIVLLAVVVMAQIGGGAR